MPLTEQMLRNHAMNDKQKGATESSVSELNNLVMKPCPCGKTPTKIGVGDAGQGYKWAMATPDCCGEWMLEFRTVGYDLQSEATKAEAIRAWNDAPRAS